MLNYIIWICIIIVLVLILYRIYSNIENNNSPSLSQTDTTGMLVDDIGRRVGGTGQFSNTETFGENLINPCTDIIFNDMNSVIKNPYCFFNLQADIYLLTDNFKNLIESTYEKYFGISLSDAFNTNSSLDGSIKYKLEYIFNNNMMRMLLPVLLYSNYTDYLEKYLITSFGPIIMLGMIEKPVNFSYSYCPNDGKCNENQTPGYVYYKLTITNNEVTGRSTEDIVLNDITIDSNYDITDKYLSNMETLYQGIKFNPTLFARNLTSRNMVQIIPDDVINFINNTTNFKDNLIKLVAKIVVLNLYYIINNVTSYTQYTSITDPKVDIVKLSILVSDILKELSFSSFNQDNTPDQTNSRPINMIYYIIYNEIKNKIESTQNDKILDKDVTVSSTGMDNSNIKYGDPWVGCSAFKNENDCNNNSPILEFVDGWYKCKYNTNFNYCDTERLKRKINIDEPVQQEPPVAPSKEDLSSYSATAPYTEDIVISCSNVGGANDGADCNNAVFNDKFQGLKRCTWTGAYCDVKWQ